MSLESDLIDFKAEIVWRVLRKRFPSANVDKTSIAQILMAQRSIEAVYLNLERRLRWQNFDRQSRGDARQLPMSSSILARAWHFLKGFWRR